MLSSQRSQLRQLSYTALGLLQLAGVLRYPADLDGSHAAAVAYVCFLATILLLGGYGWWTTRRDRGPVPTFDDHPA